MISPVESHLALCIALLPLPFGRDCCTGKYRFARFPRKKFETMGANVRRGPRECVMLDGNPKTRAALEKRVRRFRVYEAGKSALKGRGGPTCHAAARAREVGMAVELEIY